MAFDRTDEDLIRGFKGGDVEAFTEIVKRHQRPLINFFFRLIWDRDQSEDMAQEVFLRLYKYLPRYDPRAKFTTFLYKVARNLWIDRVRSVASGPRVMSLERPIAGREAELGDFVSARSPEPGSESGRLEDIERVRLALAELPEEQRTVVILAEFHGMRYEEIGQVLGIPVGTVKSRMHHAIERLKETMKSKK